MHSGRQRPPELGDERGDRLVEDHAGRGQADRLALRRVAQGADLARVVEDAGGPHLGEVVVVGGHPEHRHHGRAALLLQAGRDLDRAEGLVQDVERASEEPRLLPGDEGGGAAVGQLAGAAAGPGRAPAVLLPDQRVGELVPAAGESEAGVGGPGERVQVPAAPVVERGHAVGPEEVVPEERTRWLLERPVLDDRRGANRHVRPSYRIASVYEIGVLRVP